MQVGNRIKMDHSRWVPVAAAVWLAAAALPSALAQSNEKGAAGPRQGGFQRAALIRFEGMVSPISQAYLFRKLDKARRSGCDVVIVEIDSPGGFVHSTKEIAERLRTIDWAETVAYIPREALSGAAILALGCEEIVMAPEARFGDAGPIFQGDDALFRYVPEKYRTDLVRLVRDMAAERGRPPALAEAMVDMNVVVYRVAHRDTGETGYLSDHELESLDDPAEWEKGPLVQESREGLFLEVNGTRAAELGLADATVADRDDLINRYQPADHVLVLESTGVDTAVMILNYPLVTGLLFVIGLIALYIEFSAPGISVGGLVSLLCFSLFFWSRFLGGTSGWLEVILFGCGIIFLAVELFVIPGFGAAGITGILLMLAGVMMASQDFVVPHSGLELKALTTTLLVMVGAGCAFLVAAVWVTKHFGGIPVLNRLALKPPAAEEAEGAAGAKDGKTAATAGGATLHVGDWGVADSPLRPAGKARFGDDFFDVITDGSFVERGRQVRVLSITGNRIVVREIEEPA